MNFERIKAHFKRNQKVYVACGTTAVVVGVGVYIWKARNPVTIPRTGSVTVSDSATITSSIFNTGTMHVNVDLDFVRHGLNANVSDEFLDVLQNLNTAN